MEVGAGEGVFERGGGAHGVGVGEGVLVCGGDGGGWGEAAVGVFVFEALDHALEGGVEELQTACRRRDLKLVSYVEIQVMSV